jgi:flagellar basal-body rod protein FlgF
MQNTLLVGLSRQVALGRELDVVANNIANINTTGFKADGAVFEEFIAPTARSGDLSPADRRVSFVRDRATWIDMSQGPVERTGNPLDIAIDGKGFLAVQTPNGERYTRNGALQINANGQLVTGDGYPVLGENGPVVFQNTDHGIMISPDGTISVREGDTVNTESQRGRLRLVTFQNAGLLRKDGSGTFMAPADIAPEPDTQSRIVQGAIEKSNVRGVVEMTRMIEVTRSYTRISAMLAKQNDLQNTAVDRLAEVPN